MRPPTRPHSLTLRHSRRSGLSLDRNRSRSGFTAIELIATLTVLSLVATMVSLSWPGMLRNADLESLIERVAAIDAQARQLAASEAKPYRLVFDADRGTLRAAASTPNQDPRMPRLRMLEWSVDCTSLNVRVLPNDQLSRKRTSIDIRADGTSSDYVVCFTRREGDVNQTWVVVAGQSGEVLGTDAQEVVDAITLQLKK